MPIITISRDPYSHGKEIAEKTAEKLGYKCVGSEIIQRACNVMEFPYDKIQKALHDSPTFIDRLIARKERSIALFRAIFFEYLCYDNIVYHGLAGHIFLDKVPNVVKVRIFADIGDRISEAMRREGINYEKANKRLIQEDKERSNWTKSMYGKDNHDPGLYDLFLNLQNINIDTAVSIIINTTQESPNGQVELMRERLNDMALAAKTEARLLEAFHEVQADARNGEVFVRIKGSILQEDAIISKAKKIISEIEEVRLARVGVVPSMYVPF